MSSAPDSTAAGHESGHHADRLRCQECGDVIGVYEPMVLLAGGVPVRTSRTAIDGGGVPLEQACFHAACFARRELC